MGMFFRKSFKLGPFRFSLSKSGLGVSIGVKGARVGVRPNGRAYSSIGSHGLYHRKELGNVKTMLTKGSVPKHSEKINQASQAEEQLIQDFTLQRQRAREYRSWIRKYGMVEQVNFITTKGDELLELVFTPDALPSDCRSNLQKLRTLTLKLTVVLRHCEKYRKRDYNNHK